MLAISCASSANVVAGLGEFCPQADGVVISSPKSAKRQTHAIERGLPIDKGEALGKHHLHGKSQDPIEEARGSSGRIVLERDDCAKGRWAGAWAKFHGVEAKAQSARPQSLAEFARWGQDRPKFAIEQQA